MKDIQQKFASISVWKKGAQRAPHKPLLLLWSLARVQQEGRQYFPFPEVRQPMLQLLEEFGPYRQRHNMRNPFARLRNDGLWELSKPFPRNYVPTVKELQSVEAGFPDAIFQKLLAHPEQISTLAQNLLDAHFSETLHEDICEAIGLDLSLGSAVSSVEKRRRDPKFRQKVLEAYNFRCAICGFELYMGGRSLGLEAAHIKWHQAGGPDRVDNGLSLCSLHHKLFDRGAFKLDADWKLRVSQKVSGPGLGSHLYPFEGKTLQLSPTYGQYPQAAFRIWHVREVFRGT